MARDGSGRRRALLIATSRYIDPGLSALRAPVGDVTALATVLADADIGGFDVQQVVDQPTNEVAQAIEAFFAEGRPDDLLLLYISGHGLLAPDRSLFFATRSTQRRLLRSSAIADSFVSTSLHQTRSRSVVLILDCCHSGAFPKGLVAKASTDVDVEQRFEARGTVTLTASSGLEYAFEEERIQDLGASEPGSVFTRFLVEGLRTGAADRDRDGEISVDELYYYAYDRVREQSPHQTPGRSASGHGDLIIARNPRPAPATPAAANVAAEPPVEPSAAPPEPPTRRRRRPGLLVAGAAVLAAVVAVAVVLVTRGQDAIAIGAAPTGMAAGDGAVWACTGTNRDGFDVVDGPDPDAGKVTRIDPAQRATVGERIDMTSLCAAMAFGEGGLWAAAGATDIDHIDPAAAKRKATINTGDGVTGVTVAHGKVWVTLESENRLASIDPRRDRLVGEKIKVGKQPSDVTAGGGALWVVNRGSGTVSKIDPQSRRRIGDAIRVGTAPAAAAADEKTVWVANMGDDTVSRIEVATGKPTGAFHVGSEPSDVALAPGAVWVALRGAGKVVRVDPATGKIVKTVGVGNEPDALAVTADTLWVANHKDGTVSHVDL
jgi:Caspase domain